MKPIIAITASYKEESYRLFSTYASAIQKAGGIPVILPFYTEENDAKRVLAACDGVLLSGGADIDPKYYGEEILNGTVEIGRVRDGVEFTVFKLAREAKKPIMAICRGLQVVNVALGGSLYQDLPTQYESDVKHAQDAPKTEPSHSVNVVKDTPLFSITRSERITGNSFHHQAIKQLGCGLIPMAYADDGIIEAVYTDDGGYLRAYQWHPERLYDIDEKTRLIFSDFINAASGKDYEK